ncbi:Uma2 family endonuclease [Aurantimonas marianensis]|uniref:Uma2 family endonuclease n=1 Tax=Aurantimonas marianensis TaxID=2920428 RepID=A0A9X2KEX2_9HYPH|nr:Uma2 family endonuclease [Aurantimonas marianensis]MCP3054896.1 Uma2 family endonuclease [Aurantimonas marianensis]
MSKLVTPPIEDDAVPLNTTRAAEGLPRRRFTVAEIEAFVETGVIPEEERFELIGGEIVPISPKGMTHERIKMWLMEELVRNLPRQFATNPETTFRLSEDTFLEPDFVVFDRASGLERLDGGTCLLAIEIGLSSLGYDRGARPKSTHRSASRSSGSSTGVGLRPASSGPPKAMDMHRPATLPRTRRWSRSPSPASRCGSASSGGSRGDGGQAGRDEEVQGSVL